MVLDDLTEAEEKFIEVFESKTLTKFTEHDRNHLRRALNCMVTASVDAAVNYIKLTGMCDAKEEQSKNTRDEENFNKIVKGLETNSNSLTDTANRYLTHGDKLLGASVENSAVIVGITAEFLKGLDALMTKHKVGGYRD